jgi:hypothetical protein
VGNLVQAFIDGVPVNFGTGSQGVGQATGVPGTNALTWVAVGAAGTTYTISITAPVSAAFSHTATFDSDMKDAGVHWF